MECQISQIGLWRSTRRHVIHQRQQPFRADRLQTDNGYHNGGDRKAGPRVPRPQKGTNQN